MTFRFHSAVGLGCVFSCLFVVPGCQTKPGDGEARLFPDNLAAAAYETHARYVRAINSGRQKPSDQIPEQYWTDEIKALKPIKVYRHRVNIVVVQRVSGNTEEGKYIYIPVSSYWPHSGVDGFSFTEIGNGVFDFKRTIGK